MTRADPNQERQGDPDTGNRHRKRVSDAPEFAAETGGNDTS